MAYKVIISVNNNEEVFTLPHVPVDFPLPEPEQNNETYEGLSKDYRRIGTMGLRQLSWDSFFSCWQEIFLHAAGSARRRMGVCRFFSAVA